MYYSSDKSAYFAIDNVKNNQKFFKSSLQLEDFFFK